VTTLLAQKLSPEQISAFLAMKHRFSISYETIYKYIIKDRRRGGSLYLNLRLRTKRHRKRCNIHQKRGIMPERRHISERPASADNRSRIGHWEGDTVIGSDRRHCIVTLVDRRTGYAIIKKVESRTTSEINRACLEAISAHPWKFRTLTFDNGVEFLGYKEIELRGKVDCYFATPYHSWERGSNENLNGLVRQYIPKGSCMKRLTQGQCDWIADQLKSRPRKRHAFRAPKELFNAN
jgi:IS30 family transposase